MKQENLIIIIILMIKIKKNNTNQLNYLIGQNLLKRFSISHNFNIIY